MRKTILLMLVSLLAACEEPGEKLLTIDGKGQVAGFAFLDRDGDDKVSAADIPLSNVRVILTTPYSSNAVASVLSDSIGAFRVKDLPIGTYNVSAEKGTAGDTISVLKVEKTTVTVSTHDTAQVVVTLGYATASLRDAVKVPKGKRIALTATALNSWAAFGDSTVHFADSTGAVRAVGVKATFLTAGDRARFVATIGEKDGRPALTDLSVITVTKVELPNPTDVTTSQATAAGGALDGAQIRVKNATVLEAASLTGGDILLTVDDHSGPLDVLLAASANINTSLPISKGAELDISGVLVPIANTTKWRLKPRGSSDVTVRYPPVTIANARTKQPGQYVSIQGIALNDIATFGDLSIHVKDASGTVRVMSGRNAFVSPGDSISVLGVIAIQLGQPVLINANPSVIKKGTGGPSPASIATALAATADDGRLDAALVKITSAQILLADTVAGFVRMLVSDSTGASPAIPLGAVSVILDPNAAISFVVPKVTTRIDVTGVLVPIGTRIWALKPRTLSDLRVN